MTTSTSRRGRPRNFDTEQILDQSVELFWKQGFTATTTRTLETELGISQSSLYNAFGSKEKLFEKALSRYQTRLGDTVLTHLDTTDRDGVCRFIDAAATWVSNDEHRGCLLLNMATEGAENAAAVRAYRNTVRHKLGPAIAAFTSDDAEVSQRTELIIAAVLGLNISACGGASKSELRRMRDGIIHQIRSW